MGVRGWLKRLERAYSRRLIEIPQLDGTVARFPVEAVPEAFLTLTEGRDHPLLMAARKSSDPSLSKGAYSTDPATMRDVEDLSEP